MKLDIQLFGYYDGDVEIKVVADTKDFEKGLDKMQDSSKKAGSTIKNIVAGLGITSLIKKGFDVITSSIDDATKRFDTLNNFPKVMSNLGIASKDAQKQIDRMSTALAGLPTTLDQGALAVQRFTSKNGDVKKSTDIFLALNNAILAGGASSEIQASALEQLSQSYSKGKMDMMEWRTIQMAMPAQLKQVATAMGVTTDELGEMLRQGDNTAEVMDNFMNTIIKLNKEGSNGFASFEKQARNSTGGIRTAITVAKTQVVKGVADMITGMNKSLKKSNLPSLSEMIAKMGKEAKKVLDGVAKSLSKIDFKKVINTIKTLIPVVGSLTAGLLAMNVAMNVRSALTFAKDLGTALASTLGLIPAITKATASQQALNLAMTMSPVGLLVGGIAGLTAGLYLLQKASESNSTSAEKITQHLKEYDKAMQEADKSRQKYLDTHMNEIQYTKDLAYELETLVDENGKVKEGYEDRVNFILGELNGALGTEIQMTNGVIEGYDGVRGSIAKLIEQKRANILLDAEEEKYNTAKDRRNQLEKDYYQAQENYNSKLKEKNDKLKEIQKTYGLTNEQLKTLSKTQDYYYDESGKKVHLRHEELINDLITLNGSLQSNKNRLNEARGTYEENEKTIANYEYALKQLAAGNYEAVEKMYEDTTNYHKETKLSNDEAYTTEINALQNYLAKLKAHKKDYEDDVYNQLVAATENRLKVLEDEQKKAQEKTKASQSTLTKTYKEGIDQQVDVIEKSRPKFEESGSKNTKAVGDGIEKEKGNVKQKAKELGDDFVGPLNKYNESKQQGQNTGQGYIDGISSKIQGAMNVASELVGKTLAIMAQTQKSHSPSRITMGFGKDFADGYTIGIEKNEEQTIKAVKSYTEDVLNQLGGNEFNNALDDIYGSMQRAVDLETGKISANVELGTANKNLSQMISANASFDGTIEVQANIDGEKVWENQQKISQRKSIQYGGVR